MIIIKNLYFFINLVYNNKPIIPIKKNCPVVVKVEIIVTVKINSLILDLWGFIKYSMEKAIHNTILNIGPSLKIPLFLHILVPKRVTVCVSKYIPKYVGIKNVFGDHSNGIKAVAGRICNIEHKNHIINDITAILVTVFENLKNKDKYSL